MKQSKIFHCTTGSGQDRPVMVRFSKYDSNNHLAVEVVDVASPGIFKTITVNVQGKSDESRFAYVDTVNCPWAVKFLEENLIAKHTKIWIASGNCSYPLFEFNPDSIWEETSE